MMPSHNSRLSNLSRNNNGGEMSLTVKKAAHNFRRPVRNFNSSRRLIGLKHSNRAFNQVLGGFRFVGGTEPHSLRTSEERFK